MTASPTDQAIYDSRGTGALFVTIAKRVLEGSSIDETVGQLLFGKSGRYLAGLWIATMEDKQALKFCASDYADWARKTGRRPQPNIRSDLTRFRDLGMIVDVDGHGAKWHARCNTPLWDIFLMADTCIREATTAEKGAGERRFYTPSKARTDQMIGDLLDIHDQTAAEPPQRIPLPTAPPPRRGAEAAAQARLRPRGPNGELACTRCKEWKPEDAYSKRTDRPWLYKSRCKDCMAQVARNRYLHTKKIEALNMVGLTFTVAPTDDVVGLSCVGCGKAIVAGDTVHADARLLHERCT